MSETVMWPCGSCSKNSIRMKKMVGFVCMVDPWAYLTKPEWDCLQLWVVPCPPITLFVFAVEDYLTKLGFRLYQLKGDQQRGEMPKEHCSRHWSTWAPLLCYCVPESWAWLKPWHKMSNTLKFARHFPMNACFQCVLGTLVQMWNKGISHANVFFV